MRRSDDLHGHVRDKRQPGTDRVLPRSSYWVQKILVQKHTMLTNTKTLFWSSLALILLTAAPVSPFLNKCLANEHLVVDGTGDSQAILRMLAQQFMNSRPERIVKVPDSVGSGGGIKNLRNNRCELARTARPIKEKEQDGTLVEYRFAASPIVFAINPSVTGISNLTTGQIIDIYTGTTTVWNQLGGVEAPIYPVDREPGDSSRTILERKMKKFKEAKSVAKVFYTTPETVNALTQHRSTIGFLPLELALDSKLKAVSIDGFAPNSENIHSGNYPYVCTFSLVARKPVPQRAIEFIDFIYSPEAAAVMTKHGLMPLDRTQ